jgi:hypothetical protein
LTSKGNWGREREKDSRAEIGLSRENSGTDPSGFSSGMTERKAKAKTKAGSLPAVQL